MTYHFEIFTTFLFLSFLPHLDSATCRHNCYSGGPSVRFPFWIAEEDHDTSGCGLVDFGLSCTRNNNNNNNKRKQTIMTLPTSGEFIVDKIDYYNQVLTINDTNNCLIKLFLDGAMDPTPSPFSYFYDFGNYTFFNCSSKAKNGDQYPTLTCLSSESYKVIVAETKLLPHADHAKSSPLDPGCYKISTALIPIGPLPDHTEPPTQDEWDDMNFGVVLKWDDPDCRSCAQVGRDCGFTGKGVTGSDIGCIGSKLAKIATIIGVVLSGVLWMVGLTLRLTRISDSRQQPNTEMSMLTIDGEIPVTVAGGLDQKTIDSYPKKQLGESREFASSGENACPICLGEYEAMETIRTIPECSHYFHANCIDSWLRRNPTCPVCRNPQKGEQNKALVNE